MLEVLSNRFGRILLTCSTTALGIIPISTAWAQPENEDGVDKFFEIVRDADAIVVDGILDEAVWGRAKRIDDFHQIEPFEYGEPSQRTEVWLYYDDDSLYIAARLWDSDADSITANVLRQGEGLNSEDRFAVILDPYLDRRSGVRFEVNSNGVRWDALYQDTSNLESNWEGIWRGAATRDSEGWTAEMAIPFKTLSFNPNATDWGINFERSIPRVAEKIGWVSRNRQLNPGVAGTVSGFSDLEQGMGLDIVPSISTTRTQTYSAQRIANSDAEPSLDIFYKITPSLNGALTINTDFSATEVDDRQVNLSRFSLFFPEKRDFFLKDADIFEFGRIGGNGGGGGGGFNANRNFAVPNSATQNARPFFSRRLGLSASGQPVDIEAGGKLSGRIGRWNLGSLLIRQDQFASVDAGNIFIGRASANVLAESAVGIIMTDGDPRSNRDSSLIGTDFRYRNSRLPGGMLLESQIWYQETDNAGIYGNNRAYGFGLDVPSATGWRGGLETKIIEENFFPAVGFIDRVGVRDHQANVGYQHRLRSSGQWIRSVYSGVDYYRQERLDTGGLDTEIVALRLFSVESNTQDRFFGQYTFNREILLEDFVIYRAPDGTRQVIIPPGNYSFEEFRIGGRSGDQRRISMGGSYTTGKFYRGNQDQTNIQFTWRPSERFRFGVNYRVNEIDLPEGDFTVRLSSLRADIIFSSTLSWVNLIQYDNLSENVGFNSRLHWIPQAGREGFIVINHNLVDTDRNDSFHSTGADISIKFSYTLRF